MKMNEYINALPDSYRKDSESNNYKLLLMEENIVSDFRDDIQAVSQTLDIYKSTGATLDLYGKMYGQARGKMTDEQYRYIILQRIARNMVKGDYNSIVKALAVAFDTDTSNVAFRETENPAEVEVMNMPYGVLLNAGISVAQMEQVIIAILPVGVSLSSLSLDGTFEFGGVNEYNEDLGFGNIEQSIGGYFGLLGSDDIVIPT